MAWHTHVKPPPLPRLIQLSKPSCVAPSVGPAPRCFSSLSTWSRLVCRHCRAACSPGESCVRSPLRHTHTVVYQNHQLTSLVLQPQKTDWLTDHSRVSPQLNPAITHAAHGFHMKTLHSSLITDHHADSWSECSSLSSGRVGMVTVLLSVVRTERLLGLWKGVSPVRSPPSCLLLHTSHIFSALLSLWLCSPRRLPF